MRKIKRALQRFYNVLPTVSRATLYKEKTALQYRLATRTEEVKELTAQIKEQLAPIVDRYTRIGMFPAPFESGRYMRCFVEISEHLFDEVFMHGNDKMLIDMVGELIGREAAKEIYNGNLWRKARNATEES